MGPFVAVSGAAPGVFELYYLSFSRIFPSFLMMHSNEAASDGTEAAEHEPTLPGCLRRLPLVEGAEAIWQRTGSGGSADVRRVGVSRQTRSQSGVRRRTVVVLVELVLVWVATAAFSRVWRRAWRGRCKVSGERRRLLFAYTPGVFHRDAGSVSSGRMARRTRWCQRAVSFGEAEGLVGVVRPTV